MEGLLHQDIYKMLNDNEFYETFAINSRQVYVKACKRNRNTLPDGNNNASYTTDVNKLFLILELLRQMGI